MCKAPGNLSCLRPELMVQGGNLELVFVMMIKSGNSSPEVAEEAKKEHLRKSRKSWPLTDDLTRPGFEAWYLSLVG